MLTKVRSQLRTLVRIEVLFRNQDFLASKGDGRYCTMLDIHPFPICYTCSVRGKENSI